MKLRGRVLVLALLDPEDDTLLGEASHEDIHIALALAHPAVDVSGPERRVFASCSRHQEVLLGGGERFDPAIVEVNVQPPVDVRLDRVQKSDVEAVDASELGGFPELRAP